MDAPAEPGNGYLDLNAEPVTNGNKIKILDAAITLFSHKGYSGVSIRDITREVGIKESSLYNHFRSKEELLETIFFNFRKAFANILPPTEMLDAILQHMMPVAFLKRGIDNFKAFIDDPVMGKIWRIVAIEQYRDPLAREIVLHDIYGNSLRFLEVVFGKMAGMQRIKSLDPGMLAGEYQYAVFAMATEYTLLKFDGKDTDDIEAKLDNHIRFFVDRISM